MDSKKEIALDRFEIVDSSESEYLATFWIRNVCVSVERVKGGYLPAVYDDVEDGRPCAKGTPMSTPGYAAESALSLARGYFAAMARAVDTSPEAIAEFRADHEPVPYRLASGQ